MNRTTILHGISRRDFLRHAGAGAIAAAWPRPASAARETLYDGIQLAEPWPPRRHSFPSEPTLPPYLAEPPAIIPIDVGRQLFVDDFLIEENLLERTYHQAEYYADNPVLRPTTRWERYDEYADRTKTRSNPAAMVFSDGVFFDPADGRFKMWYMGGYSQNVCYAVSTDGLSWEKPELGVVPGSNITLSIGRDSSTVWLDSFERDPDARFKMSISRDAALSLYRSRDGIHWTQAGKTGWAGDRSTFFYNPFRKVWVFSIRDEIAPSLRGRRYWETRDFFHGAEWARGAPVPWVAADWLDPRRPEYDVPPELYNLDAVGYESLMLGLFTIFRGERTFREKPNDLVLGYSRDGFHWHRPDRRAFIGVSEQMGDWNWGNVQSAGGICLVVGDRLHFYVSGRRGRPGTNDPGVCSTGLATLRRDGFASLAEADPQAAVRRIFSSGGASVTTRPLRFSGGSLFVNADASAGAVQAEVLDVGGRVIGSFTAANCQGARGDGTRLGIRWNGARLSELAGETVRFRFVVRNARLFAFWVSGSEAGASHGYVAAGGPGLPGPIDTEGGSEQRVDKRPDHARL